MENTSKKEVETINRVCFFAIKARGGEPLRACVYYTVFRRCQGREKFSGLCPQNFSALFLDKTGV